MADDQYALCWNNYNKNLTSGFHTLYSRGDLTDVTLAADGQVIHAHRMVLAVCSPYFRSMFENTPASNHPIIFLKDISFKNLTDLVQFMYCGEVHVKQDDLSGFIAIAESLQIKGLTEAGVDADSSFSSPKNTENTAVGRSTRAAKRSIKKDFDEYTPVPLKHGKRTLNSSHKNRSSKNDDPLQETSAGASTSQSDFNNVSTKTEPDFDDNDMDSSYLPDTFNASDLVEKDDDSYDNNFPELADSENNPANSETRKIFINANLNTSTEKKPVMRRKFISLEEKVVILDRLKNGERIAAVARSLDLHEATVRTIKQSEQKIRESVFAGSARRVCRIRYGVLEKMEKYLMNWIDDCNESKVPLDGTIIKQKALEMYNKLKDELDQDPSDKTSPPAFVASKGWFENFKKRHNLQYLRYPLSNPKSQGTAVLETGWKYPEELLKVVEDVGNVSGQVFKTEESGLY